MLLAIDQSTDQAGLALLDGDRVCARRVWRTARAGFDALLQNWSSIQVQAGIAPADIDLVAVGLGPGSYTGLRLSLAAARLWALPANVTVTGVGSALAMAVAAVEERPDLADLSVAVIGDARRDSVWMIRYAGPVGPGSPEREPLVVTRPERLLDQSPALWISPDWDRLDRMPGIASLPGTVVRAPVVVSPSVLGSIALFRRRNQLPEPPLKPYYPRPAVEQRA